jgi:hypothetical protein
VSNPLLAKFGVGKNDFLNALRSLGFCLDDFTDWVKFSEKVKELMDEGVINFDVIKEETLLGIIIMESMSLQQLTDMEYEARP